MRLSSSPKTRSFAVAMFMIWAAVMSVHAQSLAPRFPKPLLTYPTPMDPDDIAGMVTSDRGPEAGVWVIAESLDLPAKLVRIVVTDDDGRYVVPDVPKSSYQVFVRGYGLDDSKRMKAWPGQQLFFGVATSNAQDAAKHRPEGLERNVVITIRDGDGTASGQSESPSDSPGVQGAVSGEWPAVRVPYPEESVVRIAQERVDDDKTGWKERRFTTTSRGQRLEFQVRPDPLAR